MGRGSDEYEKTHWGEKGRGRASTVSVPDPTVEPLVELGELVEVVYKTKKGGEVRRVEYEHAFKSPRPKLAYNSTGLVICGGRYKITADGIVG